MTAGAAPPTTARRRRVERKPVLLLTGLILAAVVVAAINVEGYLAAEGQMMTVPEISHEAQQQAEASVAGPAAEVLERLAEKLGSKASVSAVFGEPVARAGVTIIPVARVGFGFGAGAGGGRKQAEVAQGGGGGGGASAAPVGYIEIKDGNAVFKPIRDPLVDVVVPLATLVAGIVAPRIVRRLLRRRM